MPDSSANFHAKISPAVLEELHLLIASELQKNKLLFLMDPGLFSWINRKICCKTLTKTSK
jgi:hypothetical protein